LNARGFTLVEVLIALAVASLGLSAVLAMGTQSIDTSRSLRDRTLALYVGLNEITELRLSGEFPDPGRSNGETEMADRLWRWEYVISETGVESLRRIDIAVSLAERPEDVVRNVSGFIGEPGPPGVANMAWSLPLGEGADR
jgi:general secretion pathway protein I